MPTTLRLYHFMPAKYALKAIETRRLKLAALDETNDPYECLALAFQHHWQDQDFSSIQNIGRDRRRLGAEARMYGVICLSETCNEPLLWGHYAEKYKGICLGFDVDYYGDDRRDIVKPVTYISRRMEMSDFKLLIKTRFGSDEPQLGENTEIYRESMAQFKRLHYTKSSNWEYEKEWRVWTAGEKDPENSTPELFYFDFGEQMILREVLVGFRCTEENKSRLSDLIASYSPQPEIFISQRSLSTFEIEKVPL